MFFCTRVAKEIERDHYEKGFYGVRTCVMDDRCDLRSGTLTGLVAEICGRYGLSAEWLCADADDLSSISLNRTENKNGDDPSQHELDLFRDGRLDLWLAEYTLFIEVREVVRTITIDELHSLASDSVTVEA